MTPWDPNDSLGRKILAVIKWPIAIVLQWLNGSRVR